MVKKNVKFNKALHYYTCKYRSIKRKAYWNEKSRDEGVCKLGGACNFRMGDSKIQKTHPKNFKKCKKHEIVCKSKLTYEIINII